MRTNISYSNKYFATLKGDELAQACMDRVVRHQEFAKDYGYYSNWTKNKRIYENNLLEDDIVDTGELGELKALAFNHFRNIARHMINQLTAEIPAYKVNAANNDLKSRYAQRTGNQVLDYYFKTERINNYMDSTAEKAVSYGDGYIVAEWNPMLGKPITKGNKGETRFEGDFDVDVISPFDMFFDVSANNKENRDWYIFRRRVNKYDIAAVNKGKKDEIIALEPWYTDDEYYNDYIDTGDFETPEIYLYTFIHKSKPSVPNGKYCLFCGNKNSIVHLYDGDNIYKDRLPIFNLSPSSYLESAFGFTEMNIARSPQELIDTAISSIFTNAEAFGVNNVWTPEGSNLDVSEISGGMNLLTSASDQVPQVISFYKDQPGLYNLLAESKQAMETLTGVNSVVRGDVESTQLSSGVALATVINMSAQYSQQLHKRYYEVYEDLATFMIYVLQRIPTTERVIEVAGTSNRASVLSFTSKDLQGLGRVTIERVNPIIKNNAGKIEIAKDLLEKQLITVRQYFDVINTGNLGSATWEIDSSNDYIEGIREKIQKGSAVLAIPGVDHLGVIKSLMAIVMEVNLEEETPENQNILSNALNTVQGHMNLLRQGDEVSGLIYQGQMPTPLKIGGGELANLGQPPEALGQAALQESVERGQASAEALQPPPTQEGF